MFFDDSPYYRNLQKSNPLYLIGNQHCPLLNKKYGFKFGENFGIFTEVKHFMFMAKSLRTSWDIWKILKREIERTSSQQEFK